MRRNGLPLFAIALSCMLNAAFVRAESRTIGKNPGKIQGRWLEVGDLEVLRAVEGVYLGDLKVDIQWKKEENEAPIDEDLLQENFRDQLLETLRAKAPLGDVHDQAPDPGAQSIVRLDGTLEVEPGSRAARYVVGMGAGKSRSILEIHLIDHASGKEIGLYHGYGTGTGMGFKIAGGGARKMAQDDIQENSKTFAELVNELRR
jgi:hypothetical protein